MADRKYKHVLFDLDGTISDPAEGITNSIIYALDKFGIAEKRENLLKFIGPPLRDSFKENFSFTEEEIESAVAHYRVYFTDKGMFENEIYKGIPVLLEKLKSRGVSISLATLKPEPFARKILEYFNIIEYFDCVSGNILETSSLTKKDIIAKAMEEVGSSSESAVMIGDRKFDIIGARDHSMDSIAVTYGYGQCDELSAENPTYIVDSVLELSNLLG